ncbi:MAG: site-specific integrase [Clostridium sp.]
MNQQLSVTELIKTAVTTMEGDGIKPEYIKQLSYIWNALTEYLSNNSIPFTKENGIRFLEEKYGITSGNNFAHLQSIDKRRKRAVFILIHCLENNRIYRQKTYWPRRFQEPFAPVFGAFVEGRKSHGLALSTVNRDIYTLNYFSDYLMISEIMDFSGITVSIIKGFMKWLSASKGLPTLKNAASTLRLLLKYLYVSQYLADDYSSSIQIVRVRKVIPSVYSREEIENMLKSFNRASIVGIRNYAMVLIAVRLGMRASDICNLEFKDIRWDKNTIEFVTQKNGCYTVLPLTTDVGNAIIKYLKEGRQNSDNRHVFLRMQAPYGALKPASMHPIVTQAFRDANIITNPGRRHGPHALRASLATSMLEKDIALPVISEILSHSNTDTTKIYLKVDLRHLRPLALEVPDLEGVWMGGVRI